LNQLNLIPGQLLLDHLRLALADNPQAMQELIHRRAVPMRRSD
jgi:hypothetical protein